MSGLLCLSHKPIIAMLQMFSDRETDSVTRAIREANLLFSCNINGVIVKNQFGDEYMCEKVLAYLREKYPNKLYGVNFKSDYVKAFELAEKYNAKLVQIDSVCGHLAPNADKLFGERIDELRKSSTAVVLGGIHCFAYKICSGRNFSEDFDIGISRCDIAVITGTYKYPAREKIMSVVESVRGFPVFIGSGTTPRNIVKNLAICDGVIVSSCIRANGDIKKELVEQLIKAKILY